MAVVAVAPRQCFSPGGNRIASPGLISMRAGLSRINHMSNDLPLA
jgi:hypothetical protein